jgi:hypothetical protein
MSLLDFRTLTLRVDPSTKGAVAEGFASLSQGDSVKLILTNLPGADAESLAVYLFSDAVSPVALITPVSTFAAVPDRHDSFYASADISSAALTSALAAVKPGDPLTVRLYVADDNVVWADCDLDILRSPHLSQESWPDPEAPFARTDTVILRSALLAGVTPIIAMPTLTAAQREARITALLSLLSTLSQPA